jgi:hypothetical protein
VFDQAAQCRRRRRERFREDKVVGAKLLPRLRELVKTRARDCRVHREHQRPPHYVQAQLR